ncbi:MAG TPA: conjugal transfer protein TraT [Nitrospiraceae bacterium]|nr:conjugal transfer protein TraT [Nitrospiraceae bacterium]
MRLLTTPILKILAVGCILSMLVGCAAVHTSIRKRNLDVQTKMSDTIFLDPVGPDKKVIYVEVRNTSDKENFDVEGELKEKITKRGYRVTDNPDEAYYRLQANVLSVAKTTPEEAAQMLAGGFGAPLVGAAAGAAAGGVVGGAGGGVAGGILGMLGTVAVDAFVEDVMFLCVTDIQLVEKAPEGVIVRSDSAQNLAQGMAGTQNQTYSEVGKFKKYRTRVVSTANQMNLVYEDAAEPLTRGLARSLAGLF